MDQRTDRDVADFQRIADAKLCVLTAANTIPNLQAERGNDVTSFAVSVFQQGNTGGTVWIVLNRNDLSHRVKLIPFEVDDTITTFVTAATMANRDASAYCYDHHAYAGLGSANAPAVDFVISSKLWPVIPRRPAEVGL